MREKSHTTELRVRGLVVREVLLGELEQVCEEVWQRLSRHRFRGRTVVLKIKFDDFRQITRSRS